jgi:hypothetical protein
MKKAAMVFGCFVVSIASNGQRNNPVDSIRSEGHLLYRLEMCSWYATDIILREHKELRSNIGDHFSYESGNSLQCVFVSKDTQPKVIATVFMDTSLNVANARTVTITRALNHHESRLYNVRRQTFEQIESDSMFTRYENTSFNLVVTADSSCGKAYIFTEPEMNGVVIFGNDYLLKFDKKDSLLGKAHLHPNMVPVDFGKEDDPELIETFHVHSKEAGNYITPTDICTLMLYQKFARWKRHIVMSKFFVCTWDLELNELSVFTSDQWNKINNNKKPVNVDR